MFSIVRKSGVKQLPVARTRQDTQADANQNVDGSRNLGMESILDSSHPSHCPLVESSKTGQIDYNLVSLAGITVRFKTWWDMHGGSTSHHRTSHCT